MNGDDVRGALREAIQALRSAAAGHRWRAGRQETSPVERDNARALADKAEDAARVLQDLARKLSD